MKLHVLHFEVAQVVVVQFSPLVTVGLGVALAGPSDFAGAATEFEVAEHPVTSPIAAAATYEVPAPDTDSLLPVKALRQTWNKTSASDRADMCSYYLVDPKGAWDAFNTEADGERSHTDFTDFFDAKCGAE